MIYILRLLPFYLVEVQVGLVVLVEVVVEVHALQLQVSVEFKEPLREGCVQYIHKAVHAQV